MLNVKRTTITAAGADQTHCLCIKCACKEIQLPKKLQDLVRRGDVQGITNAIRLKNGQEVTDEIAAACMIIDAGGHALEALELGTIGIVLEALRSNPDDLGTRETCCMFIDALCVGDNSAETMPEVAKHSGINVLIESLRHHHMRAIYRGFSWRALDSLQQNPDLAFTIAEQGGMDLLLDALDVAKNNRYIVYSSFGIACGIINKCDDPIHAAKFAQRNGFLRMIEAMDIDKKEYIPKYVGFLLKALLARHVYPPDRKTLTELLRKFVAATRRIKGYDGSDGTKAEFLSVFYAAATDVEILDAIVEAGVIDMLLNESFVLELLPHLDLGQWFVFLYHIMGGGQARVQTLADKGVVKALISILKRAKDDDPVMSLASSGAITVLRTMVTCHPGLDACDAAIPFVIENMDRHPHDLKVQLAGLTFITDVVNLRPQRAFQAANAGAIEAAIRILKTDCDTASADFEKTLVMLIILGRTDKILQAKIAPLLKQIDLDCALTIAMGIHMHYQPHMPLSMLREADTGFQMMACTPSEWQKKVAHAEALCEANGMKLEAGTESVAVAFHVTMVMHLSRGVWCMPPYLSPSSGDQSHASSDQSHASSDQSHASSDQSHGAKSGKPLQLTNEKDTFSDAGNKKDASLDVILDKLKKSSGAGSNQLLQDAKSSVCAVCGKSASEAGLQNLLHCSACTVKPKYCSASCQKVAWKSHKAICKANWRNEEVD